MSKYMKTKIKVFVLLLAVFFCMQKTAMAAGAQISVAEAFYRLASRNDTTKIESLLHRGYSIESTDQRGYNPVCLSVARQDKTAYKNLTSYGADKSPSCLKKLPESAYRRFFGVSPEKEAVKAYTPDKPYLIGAAALAGGAVAAAYIFRGDTDKGSDGGEGGGGDTPSPSPDNCPAHSTYNQNTKTCECVSGYGNFGDTSQCYAEIAHCTNQNKASCSSCGDGYFLKNNVCYAPINNCKTQDGDICKECNSGFGVHNGDGKMCYTNIPQCKEQDKNTCSECVSGYGTHGDPSRCYQNIENCISQIQTACKECRPGYDTYGDPAANKCYSENPCSQYANTVPVDGGPAAGGSCQCDANRGYTGEPGSCSQADDGNYQEGDGNQDVWNNLNEKYCNSHGKYDTNSGLCLCYRGYASSTTGCADCEEGYLKFNGLCFANAGCDASQHLVQSADRCVCDTGYLPYYEGTEMKCMAQVTCPLHYEQVRPGDAATACECKANFNETCDACLEGFDLDVITDTCIRTSFVCEEEWSGSKCDVCPPQFMVTTDSLGNKHCGLECAENRLPIAENPSCSDCADGYKFSQIDNTCVINECTTGEEGYIDINGTCTCDTANGWSMSPLGRCVQKEPDYIGVENSNINNSTIDMDNNGILRDVYGMKPVIQDGDDISYYDNVYNALASTGNASGTINIVNQNVIGNEVYGISSPSNVYNAGAIVGTTGASATAAGTINITDSATASTVYGLHNDTSNTIYNAFARNTGENSAQNAALGSATASIIIAKTEGSTGDVYGIAGGGNIYNAYASTDGGIAANVEAVGNIEITHEGTGDVIGIKGNSSSGRINNSLAYLNSAISDAISEGTIKVSGIDNVYGIWGSGGVANSETQFDKSFNQINNFSSHGKIEVETSSAKGSAYGIYVNGSSNQKAEVYNAMGYNSTGEILVSNKAGGNAYGIRSDALAYAGEEIDEDGKQEKIYNNVYNAFRSSAKYGGDNVAARGNITVNISGNSNASQEAVGIYGASIFNSYANSGSSVKLESVGNITVNDSSRTSNMFLKGMEGRGVTIANAYNIGQNQNTLTNVLGNINLNISGSKSGNGGQAAGIYSTAPLSQVGEIFNAALINDKSTVEGNINITATARTFNSIYGIYASSNDINGSSSDDGQPKTVYNAYYENSTDISEGKVRGNITVKTTQQSDASTTGYYGIYILNGTAYNVYATNEDADVKGTITVDVVGGENSGTAAGMYGRNATLNNSGNSEITVKTSGKSMAYGMKGDTADIYNNAVINVESAASKAYGIYLDKGTAVNDENGVITVTGNTENYGIYALSDGEDTGSATVINRGTINLNGTGENVGIYASGSTATVENSGTININGEKCSGADCSSAIKLEDGAQYVNNGTTASTGDINFDAMGGEVILGAEGRFEAAGTISGELKIAQAAVMDTFDATSILKEALAAQDASDTVAVSKSYMYNSSLMDNGDGTYDIANEIKDFSTLTDADKAGYLDLNYKNQKNMELFNTLKKASTASELKETVAETFATAVLPNITQENLKVMRSLDRKMMSELFNENNEDVRRMVGADAMYIGRDDVDTLTGYDITSESIYALYDKRLNNRYRLGVGISFTNTDTDYNNDSTRNSIMVQGYIPLTYTNSKGLTAVSMARLGYADGDYKRRSLGKTYEGDTKDITYGLLNEVRYKMDLGYVSLTPFAGINAIGWYQDSIKESGGDLAVRIDSENILSLESALGFYLDKEVEFNHDNRLNVALGIGWYHEFADPYGGWSARHGGGAIGSYKLKADGNIDSRDRGILSAKVNYDYKDFSIYGELMQYLEDEYPIKVDVGLKYRF